MKSRVLGIVLSLLYGVHVWGVVAGGSATDLVPGNVSEATVVDPSQKALENQLLNHARVQSSRSVITDFPGLSEEDALGEKEKIEEAFALLEKIKKNSNLVTQPLHVATLIHFLKENTNHYFNPGTFLDVTAGLLEELSELENVSESMKITIAKEYQDYQLKKSLRELNEVVLEETFDLYPKEFAEKYAYTKLELNRNPGESLFANKNALIGKKINGKVLFQGSVYYAIQGKVISVTDTGFTLETESHSVIQLDGSDFFFFWVYVENSYLEAVPVIANKNTPITWKEPVTGSIGSIALEDKIKFYHTETGSKSLRVHTKNIGSSQVKPSFLKGLYYAITFTNPNESDSYLSFDAPIVSAAKEFKDANGKFFILVRTENDFYVLDPENDSIVTEIKIQDTQSHSFPEPLRFADLEDESKVAILRLQGGRIFIITKNEDPQGVSAISPFNTSGLEFDSPVLIRLNNGNLGVILEEHIEHGMRVSVQLDLVRNNLRVGLLPI